MDRSVCFSLYPTSLPPSSFSLPFFPPRITIPDDTCSWDVGQGAQDDASGAYASWQALRILKALGLVPRRTIRSVLWVSEEWGGEGARQYARDHRLELTNMSAAIEMDEGLFKSAFIISAVSLTVDSLRPKGFGVTSSSKALSILQVCCLFLTLNVRAGMCHLRASSSGPCSRSCE